MNPLKFDTLLSVQLNAAKLEETSPDMMFVEDLRWSAISDAVREYSRYFSRQRRYGYGEVYENAKVGDTVLKLLGGPFIAGQSFTVGYGMPSMETVTIGSVIVDDAQPYYKAGTPVAVTLNTPLANIHNGGEMTMNAVMGLSLVANQDTYFIPYDFIEPDPASFDIAVGAKCSYRKHAGFYDSGYSNASALSGTGFGSRSNYSAGYGYYGTAYNNANNPQTLTGIGDVNYRWIEGHPPTLFITPVPTASKVLDFVYRCEHTLESIPERQSTILLHYSKYRALMAQAAVLAGTGDFSQEGTSENYSGNARTLSDLAQTELNYWNSKVVNRPICVMG